MNLFRNFIVQASVVEGEKNGLSEVFENTFDKGMQTLEIFTDGLFLGIFLTVSLAVLGMGILAILISFLFVIPFRSKAEKKSFLKTQGIIMLVFLVASILIFAIPYAILM